LPGRSSFGRWYQFDKFNDQHFRTDGKSLADPLSTTNAAHAITAAHISTFAGLGSFDCSTPSDC